MHIDAQSFIDDCQAERDRVIGELQSYEPVGVMHLWRGRSMDHLLEVTDERIDALRRELARIDATLHFVTALLNII
jgi:hypothetical protein